MIRVARRSLLAGASSLMWARGVAAVSGNATAVEQSLAAIERRHDGRLGVLARDTGSGREIGWRPDERFALCSTFKLLAVAAVLQRVDRGSENLARRIAFGAADLDSYAPVTKQHVAEGTMAVVDLCAAAAVWSDNTAGNLLLAALGGPEGLTTFVRTLGDVVTRLDRTEPMLNTAIPGDERDTTSPRSMVADMQAILLGSALSETSRLRLEGWMSQSTTGLGRIHAGVPPGWLVADKSGSGANATANDIALVRRPRAAPILLAIYYTQSRASPDERNAVHADVARLIAAEL